MSSRKTTVAVDLAVLESAAIAAVRSIESGYSAASKSIMAYVLGAKVASATPPTFDAGITRIADAIPGIAKITVGAYISNARRIFAADKEALAKAVKEAGKESIKALAAACPTVSKAKAEGQAKRAEEKKASAKTPGLVTTKTADADPTIIIANALVQLRKQNASKRRVLSLIGELEDLLDTLKSLTKAA